MKRLYDENHYLDQGGRFHSPAWSLLFSVLLILVGLTGALPLYGQVSSSQHAKEVAERSLKTQARKFAFERNMGQMEGDFLFLARDVQADYFFLKDEVRTTVKNAAGNQALSYGMRFVNALTGTRPHGIGRAEEQVGQLNHLQGEQLQEIPQHNMLRYPNLWNKIYALFDNSPEGLKYDFIVQPGGNPADVQLEMYGVSNLKVTPEGELSFATPLGTLVKGKPFTYQNINGKQVEVSAAYKIEGNRISFEIGAYDKNHQLVIDPVALKWATVLGGNTTFGVKAAHLDAASGNLYLTGHEGGVVYPSNFGFPGPVHPNRNAFVMCMKGDGSEILWKTRISASNGAHTQGLGINVDAQGNVYAVMLATLTGAEPFLGVTPEVPGIVTSVPNTHGSTISALMKFNANGSTLKYFTYLIDPKPGLALNGINRDFSQAILLDAQGHVFIPVQYNMSSGAFPDNAFYSRNNELFNQEQPQGSFFTVLSTINTQVSGASGLVHNTVLDIPVMDADQDAAGNIYLLGWSPYRRAGLGVPSTPEYDLPFFTHKVLDLNLLQAGGSEPHALIKINPEKNKVLFGSWVGFESSDGYISSAFGSSITVSPNGDVYLGTSNHSYPNSPSGGSKITHKAQKWLKLQDWYDPDCAGWCPMVQAVEKYPADNYQNPEWVVTFPTSWSYISPEVAIDAVRGKIHVHSSQDKFALSPNPPIRLVVTEDAIDTLGVGTNQQTRRTNGHYMQLSVSGDLEYATVLAPESPSDLPLYTSIADAMLVNPSNGEAIVVRRTVGTPSNRDFVTKSYRDFQTNQQVEVFGAGSVYSEQPYTERTQPDVFWVIQRTQIAVFHQPYIDNTIFDFAPGENSFCVGALIVRGAADGPLEGNQPSYKTGDGSSELHNLPYVFRGGVRSNHPQPAGALTYQWQSSTNGAAWMNIRGGNKPLLQPPLAAEPGSLKFRRLIFIGGDTIVSNEIEATITGTALAMQLSGPTDPVYFCPGAQQALNIGITGVAGNISWQWYNGFTPIDNSLITPASGTNVPVGSFAAAVAATATQAGYYRLVVTDEASGCKKELFVAVLPKSEKIYTSNSVNLCPGVSASIVLGAGVVNPAFDYKFAGPGITDPSQTRPTVSQAGTYTLQVSLKGENNFCVGGETTVQLNAPTGPHDPNLVALTDKGFCQDDAPTTIGLSNAPTSGYTYSWSPAVFLNAYSIANPIFDPQVGVDKGLREINYVFKATRESDGCVFESSMTVRDTAKAEVNIIGVALYAPGCIANSRNLADFEANENAKYFKWEVVSTTYPGGLSALLASPDFGFDAKGTTIGTSKFPKLFYPEGDYTIDLQVKGALFPVDETQCYASDMIQLIIDCGKGPFVCFQIGAAFMGTSGGTCGGNKNILRAQAANWVSSAWSVVQVNGAAPPAGSGAKGLFLYNGDVKGTPLGAPGNHPNTAMVDITDPVWGFPDADSVRYRFTGIYEEGGEMKACESEITVYKPVNIPVFDLKPTVDVCAVAGSGTILGSGPSIPYMLSAADFNSIPFGDLAFRWRINRGGGSFISNDTTLYPTLTPPQTTTFALFVSDSYTGCTSQDTIQIRLSTVKIDAGRDISGVCPGSIVQLGTQNVDGVAYSWTPGAGMFFPTSGTPNSMVAQPFLPFPNSPSGYEIVLQVTEPISGCIATDTVLLFSSNDPPVAPAAVIYNVCAGATSFIGPANYSTVGRTFAWTATAPASTSWLSATNVVNPVVSVPDDFTGVAVFTLTITNGTCGSVSTDFTVVVPDPGIDLGAAPLVTNCGTPLAQLKPGLSLPSGFTGVWLPASGLFTNGAGTAPYTSGASLDVYVEKVSQSRDYTLRVTHTSSKCISVFYKTVDPPAGQSVSAGEDLSYCPGDAVTFDAVVTGGGTVSWTAVGYNANPSGNPVTAPNGATASLMLSYLSATNIAAAQFSQSVSVPGAYRYRLTVDYGAGCTLSDEVIVRVRNFVASVTDASLMACEGTPTLLGQSTSPISYSYVWRALSPSGEVIANPNVRMPLVRPMERTVYEVFYTDPLTGCNNTQIVTVNIAEPLVLAGDRLDISCDTLKNEDVSLNIDSYAGVLNRKWYQDFFPSSTIMPPLAVEIPTSRTYYLEGERANGCRDTFSVEYRIEDPQTPAVISTLRLPAGIKTVNLANYTPANSSVLGGTFTWHSDQVPSVGNTLTNLVVGEGTYYLVETTPEACVSAAAPLQVTLAQPSGLTAAFLEEKVTLEVGTTLVFDLRNYDYADSVKTLSFNYPLPAGIFVDSVVLNGCSGTLSATVGNSVIGFTNGMMGPGDNCSVSIIVSSQVQDTIYLERADISVGGPMQNYTVLDTVILFLDEDGDGVPEADDIASNGGDPEIPCLPVQPAGYKGYYAGNVVWAPADCDGDGATNGEEHEIGSDPYSTSPDTDLDGISDTKEIVDGSDPADPCDPNITADFCDFDDDGIVNDG